ncbi:MAG: penicillin-binding protein 2 [Thermodesulfobacteriota bacterium]|nr:penicillin-binding protein 2 [Thermodesulfobacteriota bacterium]
MKSIKKRHINFRLALVIFLFIILFTAIGARAVYLQVYCGPWLAQKAADQYERSFELAGNRGTIYDTNFAKMAVSNLATSIAAYPKQIKNAGESAKVLSPILKVNRKILKEKLISEKPFVWIKRQSSPNETKAVKKLKLEGIAFIPEYNRFYPLKTLAAQVIGFTGTDGNGLEGIEFYYDSYLRGTKGNFTILKDAFGNGFVSGEGNVPDHSGKNIILTIDKTIQYITENALERTVTSFSAKSGMAIVMVPKTGAMLAIAHYPFFNPNSFKYFRRELWRNRAITDPFEPGSTMKIFSAAAAIQSGGSSPNTIYFCENGAYKIGRKTIHDNASHGWLSLQQIVKYSSNIGAVKISEKIGPERLYSTLRHFGFGTKTGIDCPGETAGSLALYKQWTKLDTGAISFGHGISVSAVQLVEAVSAIANDGILMKPYLVKAITDKNGQYIHRFKPRKMRRVISTRTAKEIAKIMKTVITRNGTGTLAALEGYSVCGKTGTSQKIGKDGTYSEDKYIASFTGFTPAENPEIAVLVVIDEPVEKYYGGIVAAPAFKKIAHETLNHLNISPTVELNKLTFSLKKRPEGETFQDT